MYIRDAQGRLRWIPPPGYASQLPPPIMVHGQVAQQSMRHQIQEEWIRFNAPPLGDQMHFVSHEHNYSRSAPPMAHLTPVGHIPHYNGIHRAQQQYHRQRQQLYNPEPPIPRVITSASNTRDHVPQTSVGISPSILSSDESKSNSFSKRYDEFEPTSPNVTCMNTLFGSSVKNHRNESKTFSMGAIRCNQLDPSTAELELRIKLPDFYMDHSNPRGVMVDDTMDPFIAKPGSGRIAAHSMHAIQCNGIRGPGKTFDYSCGNPQINLMTGMGGQVVQSQNHEKASVGDAAFNNTKDDATSAQISAHDSFDNNSYLVDSRFIQKEEKSERKVKKQLPLERDDSEDNTVASKPRDKRKSFPGHAHDDPKNDLPRQAASPPPKESVVGKSHHASRATPIVISDGQLAIKDSSVEKDCSNVREERHRQRVQWNDEMSSTTNKYEPVFSAKDQAALAQSIREICLERIGRATSDLDRLDEEYPSFDEPREQTSTATKKKEVHFKDEISLDVSSTGSENRPRNANCNVATFQSTTQSRDQLSKEKTMAGAEEITKIHVKANANAEIPTLKPMTSAHAPNYFGMVPEDESRDEVEEVASC